MTTDWSPDLIKLYQRLEQKRIDPIENEGIEMKVGSIVFGPKVSPTERRHWDNIINQAGGSIGSSVPHATACNCIGPQPGESKCPCALSREMEMGRKMVDEGVTVNGKRYRLVPDEAT